MIGSLLVELCSSLLFLVLNLIFVTSGRNAAVPVNDL